MRTYSSGLKIASGVTLAFFLWSFGPLFQVAVYAAEKKQSSGARVQGSARQASEPPVQGSGERFEKALEGIREHINKAEEKSRKGEEPRAEIETIRTKKAELETIDSELKTEFAATEKKLKDAHLPSEILERHHKFVKHYQDNLKELIGNLEQVEKAQTRAEVDRTVKKAKLHLEKTKPPRKHKPLDPNKLPHRMVKAKERAPRLKKEEFEKDFGPKKHRSLAADLRGSTQIKDAIGFNSAIRNSKSAIAQKPILVAANGSLAGLLSSSPEFKTQNLPFSVSSVNSEPALESLNRGANEAIPHSEFRTPHSNVLHSASPFLLAQAAQDLPAAEDLAETIEVKFTNEIKEVAALLKNDPVLLYEFVKNNVEYEPYYGSLKGSQQTLFEQAGNDFDQASLLIALYRSIGIQARYVYGTIQIPIDKAISWLGAPDALTAVKLLSTNGVPVARNATGAITLLRVEHIWIEAYLPYGNYRGKINTQNGAGAWIPLDPSFKEHSRNAAGINPYVASGMNVDDILQNYQNQVKSNLPVQEYRSILKSNIEQNLPDKNFYNLIWTATIAGKALGLLPNTLEYETIVIGSKFSEITPALRHKITFSTTDNSTNPLASNGMSYTANLPDIVNKRITFSYIPATPLDENIINNYGSVYDTPPYLLQVKPVLKIDGQTVATGDSIGMGVPCELAQTVIVPHDAVEEVVTFPIVAGAYYAIGLDAQKITSKTLYLRSNKYIEKLNATDVPTDRDEVVGEFLHLMMTGYLEQKDIANTFIANTMQFRDIKRTTVALMGINLLTSYVFSIPVKCIIGSFMIDVKREVSNPVDISGMNRSPRDFNIMYGMNTSFLESSIFEITFGIEGISTLKALALANSTGIPIYKITQANSSTYLPLLEVGDEVKIDIINALNQGKRVTVSQRDVQLNKWKGVGYIIENPETGEAAYMISGGLAGGFLTDVIADFERLLSRPLPYDHLDLLEVLIRIRKLINDRKVRIPNPLRGLGYVTDSWGPRKEHPITHKPAFHNGIDLGVETGTPVIAVADGIVKIKEQPEGEGYGKYITINHGTGVIGVYTLYAHLSKFEVEDGAKVTEGQMIARSGNSGGSTAPHLHFSIFVGVVNSDGSSVDPQLLLEGNYSLW